MKKITFSNIVVMAAASVVPLAFIFSGGSSESEYKLVPCPASGYELVPCPEYKLVPCPGYKVVPCPINIVTPRPPKPPKTPPWFRPKPPPPKPKPEKPKKPVKRRPGGGGLRGGNSGNTGGFCKEQWWHPESSVCRGEYKSSVSYDNAGDLSNTKREKEQIDRTKVAYICEKGKDKNGKDIETSCCLFTGMYHGIECATASAQEDIEKYEKECQKDMWAAVNAVLENPQKSLEGYTPSCSIASEIKLNVDPVIGELRDALNWIKNVETLWTEDLNKPGTQIYKGGHNPETSLQYSSVEGFCETEELVLPVQDPSRFIRCDLWQKQKDTSEKLKRRIKEQIVDECQKSVAKCGSYDSTVCLTTCKCNCDVYEVGGADGTSCCYGGQTLYGKSELQQVFDFQSGPGSYSLNSQNGDYRYVLHNPHLVACDNCKEIYPSPELYDGKTTCPEKICCNDFARAKENRKRINSGKNHKVGVEAFERGSNELEYCPEVCCRLAGCTWEGNPMDGTCTCPQGFEFNEETCSRKCAEGYKSVCEGPNKTYVDSRGVSHQCLMDSFMCTEMDEGKCKKKKLVCQKCSDE